MSAHHAVLSALGSSLASFATGRVVQRSLQDPATLKDAQLRQGVLCLVAQGGGSFANYRGRVGQLGRVQAAVVGFVRVDEHGTGGEDVEDAELLLLEDVLRWAETAPVTVLPGDFRLSGQMEHPYGWFVLELDIRPNG